MIIGGLDPALATEMVGLIYVLTVPVSTVTALLSVAVGGNSWSEALPLAAWTGDLTLGLFAVVLISIRAWQYVDAWRRKHSPVVSRPQGEVGA